MRYFRNDWNLKNFLKWNNLLIGLLNKYFKNYVNDVKFHHKFLLDLCHIKFFNQLKIIIILFIEEKKYSSSTFYFSIFSFFYQINRCKFMGKNDKNIACNILLFSRETRIYLSQNFVWLFSRARFYWVQQSLRRSRISFVVK